MLRTIFAAGTMGQKLPVDPFTVFLPERNPTGNAVFTPDAFPGFVDPDPYPRAPGPGHSFSAHDEAGEALASVLNDLSVPAFFGDEVVFEGIEGERHGQVDWEELERSLRMSEEGMNGGGYAEMGWS